MSTSPNAPQDATASQPARSAPQLALPAPDDSSTTTHKLDVSTSAPVSLYDSMGPTIVAQDGTISRIANWAEMDSLERSRVLRVLGKRNQLRLEELNKSKK